MQKSDSGAALVPRTSGKQLGSARPPEGAQLSAWLGGREGVPAEAAREAGATGRDWLLCRLLEKDLDAFQLSVRTVGVRGKMLDFGLGFWERGCRIRGISFSVCLCVCLCLWVLASG